MKRNKFFASILTNWPAKVLSIVLAIAVYMFIHYTTLGVRQVQVPLQVLMPPGLEAASLVPDTVGIRITGDEDLIYLVNPTAITASVDFSYVTQPGISKAPVFLSYVESLYNSANVSISAEPSQFRILFEKSGGNE